jgi:hypothetical protein
MEHDARAALPWYRQAWPWLVMLPPAVAVVGGIATITLAITSNDGVVAADYYKRGLAINDQLARTQRAATLGIAGTLTVEGIAGGDNVRVHLASREPMPADATLKLRLVHPGRSGADREATLARSAVAADGRSAEFVGQWQPTADVHAAVGWGIVVEARDWRIDGDGSMIHARPQLHFGAPPPAQSAQ